MGHPLRSLYLLPKAFFLSPQSGYGSHLLKLSGFWLGVTSHSTSFRWKDFLLFPLSPSLDIPLTPGIVTLSPKGRFPGPSSHIRDNGTITFLPAGRNLFDTQGASSLRDQHHWLLCLASAKLQVFNPCQISSFWKEVVSRELLVVSEAPQGCSGLNLDGTDFEVS